ncbi:putative late blight resistance protein homolog R1B-16 [Salvia splendens]|uniref:putative late blight resistance protein homolog R1B-16 n=1 Tax=Salvia splendens TaxID=180675 RepID=UPI001C25E5DA|nr:putative late blight resistance protein homolog R1B-16 [Salvia splendens]
MATAFAALVSLESNLRLIYNHPKYSFHFEEEQIRSLEGSVSFLIDFMKSYDNSLRPRKQAAEALEMRIAHAAQVAEDVIESHIVDHIRSGKTRSPRFLLDLQKAIQDMDYMRRKALNVRAQSGREQQQQQQTTYSSSAAAIQSTPPTFTMVGFDEIVLQLLGLLTGGPSSRPVIPIKGMGGIGKTTLARNVLQHPYIVEYFDVRLWATISQEYSLPKILSELLFHLKKSNNGTVDELQERLHKSLIGQRYLIVLDDMWNAKALDDMRFLFRNTKNDSRIVVTTRNSDVVEHLGVSPVAMSFLDEDNSWRLFCQKAFADQQGCPPELEETAKKIVAKCKGLPLSIVVVGGHLRKSSMAVDYWENVAESIMNPIGKDEHCLNVLSLSYSHLPVHLKPCFLFIGAFPEDEIISARDVYKLWIAEGFIQQGEYSSLEVAAGHCLWDLYMRNLILVDRWRPFYGIYAFKLHDLVREICLKIAKDVEFLYVFQTPKAINRKRRVVISREATHEAIASDSLVRFVMWERSRYNINNLYELKLLRTLCNVATTSSSGSIFKNLNLRYLNIDLGLTIRPILYYLLPSSMSLLWNLQILTINIADQSKVIAPYEIWEMLQLRYLEVDPICLIDPLPVDRLHQTNNFVMRNLISLFRVENFRFSDEVCKRIHNIRELRLSYCGEVSSYYCPGNLSRFNQLQVLWLQFDDNSKWREFVTSLTFPSKLMELRLRGSGVDWEELTMMVGPLPHFIKLELLADSVTGSIWNPKEEKFLRLKYLTISGCGDLVSWNADRCHFPVLEYLRLTYLPKLEELPPGIGEIPTLVRIVLRCCSASSTISAMRTLVEQEEQGNDSLRLDIYFEGDEETLESFNHKVQEEGLTSTNLSLHLNLLGSTHRPMEDVS